MYRSLYIRHFIYPWEAELDCSDQFTFCPTGLTTTTMISVFRVINNLLTTNPFIRVFAIDFREAQICAIQTFVAQYSGWRVHELFHCRLHCTKFSDVVSDFPEIFASVFQDSGVSPASTTSSGIKQSRKKWFLSQATILDLVPGPRKFWLYFKFFFCYHIYKPRNSLLHIYFC